MLVGLCLCRTEKLGDGHPDLADHYFTYGKALLENAISQTAVLGKEEAEEAVANELENPGACPSFCACATRL